MSPDWLEIHEGNQPLIVRFPHTGTLIPPAIEARLASPWLARKDADWWIHELYAFARELGAKFAVVADVSAYRELQDALSGSGIEAGAGELALLAGIGVRLVMTMGDAWWAAATDIDSDRLLERADTLYLCGPSYEQARVQGLFAALVASVVATLQGAEQTDDRCLVAVRLSDYAVTSVAT